jgi:hypothetical protein
MPHFIVKVTYTYPVQATNGRDAFSTLNDVIKTRFINISGSGQAEVIEQNTHAVVLRAVLQIDKSKRRVRKNA